jgi:hypothetical protein
MKSVIPEHMLCLPGLCILALVMTEHGVPELLICLPRGTHTFCFRVRNLSEVTGDQAGI